MRKPSEVIINGKTLEEILENHLHWLKRDVDGWKDMRANLDGADISDTDLRDVNLKYAHLDDVDFCQSNLKGADLRRASLHHAYFGYANLCEANLNDADIVNGNFYCADLSNANLINTYLVGSHLVRANLQCANLGWAGLRNCVFYDTDLRDCNFMYANFRGSKNIPYIPLQCPSDGAFVGWKTIGNVLIKLEIPEDAKRSSATTNKCRCDKAKVLGFYDSLGVNELDMTELVNERYEKCKYVKGEMVYPDSFDEDRWNECSHGIHFFVNKQDAINYNN